MTSCTHTLESYVFFSQRRHTYTELYPTLYHTRFSSLSTWRHKIDLYWPKLFVFTIFSLLFWGKICGIIWNRFKHGKCHYTLVKNKYTSMLSILQIHLDMYVLNKNPLQLYFSIATKLVNLKSAKLELILYSVHFNCAEVVLKSN